MLPLPQGRPSKIENFGKKNIEILSIDI